MTVYIAVPAYRGDMQIEAVQALVRGCQELSIQGIDCIIDDRVGSGLIHNVRNLLLARFLGSNASDLFFIDDDVAWPTGAFTKLLRAPADFVSAVYRVKVDQEEYRVQWGSDDLWTDENGLLEVDGVPAGFIRLSRRCVEEMVKNYSHLEYDEPEAPGGKAWGLFYPEIIDRRDWGEDLNFCRRWKAIGGRIWIDPTLEMQHVGRKNYRGCIGDWLRAR